ncbi:MAG: twin-arginine translocase TatA/TatE family subunit [Actinomycetes bacterium]
MIPQLGPLEIVVVVLVALLVFGPHRMPEVGRQVGRGLRQVRRIQDQIRDELDSVLHADDPAPSPHADEAVVPPSAPAEPEASAASPDAGTAPSRYRPPAPAPAPAPNVPEVGRAPSRFRPPASP